MVNNARIFNFCPATQARQKGKGAESFSTPAPDLGKLLIKNHKLGSSFSIFQKLKLVLYTTVYTHCIFENGADITKNLTKAAIYMVVWA